jgi:hypothetical protein
MTKEDWIWIAIRIFGIYLIVLAIISIPGIINSGFMTISLWDIHQAQDKRFGEMSMLVGNDGKSSTGQDIVWTSEKLKDIKDIYTDMSFSMFESNLASFVSNIVEFILFLFCGVYFLRSGKLVFKLISTDIKEVEKI